MDGCSLVAGCSTIQPDNWSVSEWDRFERTFKSRRTYANPLQDAELDCLHVTFRQEPIDLRLWDGGQNWKVRFTERSRGMDLFHFMPEAKDEFAPAVGTFVCTAATARTRFDQHGPVRISKDGHHLEHEDGTAFLAGRLPERPSAGTGRMGALSERTAEAEVHGGSMGRNAMAGITRWDCEGVRRSRQDRIAINPDFFQKLDQKADAVNRAGLLNAPVLLWAIGGGSKPQVNPGFALQEDQAILLARYMIARWGAHDVLWILPGDGDYRGPKAERWKRIGRAVFGDEPHAPVVLHPGGMQWVLNEFRDEKWLDIHGYQSGHGDDDRTLRWIFAGPPAMDWQKEPARPFINLEPPYENHIAYQLVEDPAIDGSASDLLSLPGPMAGVTYGGYGVWGWMTARNRRRTILARSPASLA